MSIIYKTDEDDDIPETPRPDPIPETLRPDPLRKLRDRNLHLMNGTINMRTILEDKGFICMTIKKNHLYMDEV